MKQTKSRYHLHAIVIPRVRTLCGYEWKVYRAAIAWGLLLGTLGTLILVRTLRDTQKASPEVFKQTIQVQAVETPCDYDPITYLRCRGEQLGVSNKNIMTLIRVARCESGLRPDAIGKNTNGTFDMGVFQINDVHSKKISRADRLDFVHNIDYAYQLFLKQGLTPWNSSKHCWNK